MRSPAIAASLVGASGCATVKPKGARPTCAIYWPKSQRPEVVFCTVPAGACCVGRRDVAAGAVVVPLAPDATAAFALIGNRAISSPPAIT